VVWFFRLLVLCVVVFASLTAVVARAQTLTPAPDCPPGYLVINGTWTYICAIPVSNYTSMYVSLSLVQQGNNFSFSVACLAVDGCDVKVGVYDYYNGTLSPVDTVAAQIPRWDPRNGTGVLSRSYSVNGRGVVKLTVNTAELGYYVAPAVSAPEQASRGFAELASLSPLVAIAIGLLVVAVPLGWLLQRELGLAGLALAGCATLFFILVFTVTGSAIVATVISVLAGLIGIVLVISQGGSP
jgi:hypothetical protein